MGLRIIHNHPQPSNKRIEQKTGNRIDYLREKARVPYSTFIKEASQLIGREIKDIRGMTQVEGVKVVKWLKGLQR